MEPRKVAVGASLPETDLQHRTMKKGVPPYRKVWSLFLFPIQVFKVEY